MSAPLERAQLAQLRKALAEVARERDQALEREALLSALLDRALARLELVATDWLSTSGPLYDLWLAGLIAAWSDESLNWPSTQALLRDSDEDLWCRDDAADSGEVARYRALRDDLLLLRSEHFRLTRWQQTGEPGGQPLSSSSEVAA